MTRVVLNADDFGLAPAHTRRVAALRAKGLLTDVSLLTNGTSFDEAALGLRGAGHFETGVHLCITGGERPVSAPRDIPSLLSGPSFRAHWPAVLLALTAGRIRRAEVEREWEAQIARAEGAGLRVTHLDSHQNLHLHPFLFPVAVALARRFRVPFVRAPRGDDPPGRPDAPPLSRLRARLLALLGGRGRRLLDAAGLPEPPRVLGLAEAGHMTAARFQSAVAELPEGDYEFALHAGDEDDVTRARYNWGYEWREESETLESGAVAAALAARGIATASFGALT
ncbi:MAG: ChbG/HpnK family deacetylase [Thermoanaerobaculia bacterium]|nr:ChbG/HpnK family deacetylase [Thermoanaerobaculia bacterium]